MSTKDDLYWNLGLALCFAVIAFIMTRRGDGPVPVLCAVVPSIVCAALAVVDACYLSQGKERP